MIKRQFLSINIFSIAVLNILLVCSCSSRFSNISDSELNSMVVSIIVAYDTNGDKSLLKYGLKISKKSIKKDAKNPVYYTNRANLYSRLGEYNKSIKCLKKVANIKGYYPELCMGIGFLYEKIGKLEEAKIYYKKALSLYEADLNKTKGDINKYINYLFAKLFLYSNTVVPYVKTVFNTNLRWFPS